MKVTTRQERLLYGAFLAVGLVIVTSYLRLEHSWLYRIIAILFLALVTWESVRLYTVHYAKLYLLFLLAAIGLYAFPHHHPLAITIGLLVVSFALLFLGQRLEKDPLTVRELLAGTMLFSLATVTLANFPTQSIFSKAAIAMLGTAGLAEIFKYPGVERWRVALSYGILTLLLILFILTTAALR
jgi:hypothetical protein